MMLDSEAVVGWDVVERFDVGVVHEHKDMVKFRYSLHLNSTFLFVVDYDGRKAFLVRMNWNCSFRSSLDVDKKSPATKSK